jgi:hypothetical protein
MFFERPAAVKSGAWLLPAGIASLAALLLTALAWPVSAVVRRHYRVAPQLSASDAAAQRWMRIVASVTAIAWAGWIGLIVAMITDLTLLAAKTDPWLYLLQVTGAVVFVAGTVVGLWAAWNTVRGSHGALAKTWAVLLALALLVSLWIAVSFHLVSFGAKY